MAKIGIFSGTFDPVHGGHLEFALQAAEQASLSKVYLLPEPQPRRKDGVTHYSHRVAMLKLAIKPFRRLDLLELPDKQFSVNKTLPRLQQRFKGDRLCLLVGTDMLELLTSDVVEEQWPDYRKLLDMLLLVVGVRGGAPAEHARNLLDTIQPEGMIIAETRRHASSRDIRSALQRGRQHADLLPSIMPYIKSHWLYASVNPSSNVS